MGWNLSFDGTNDEISVVSSASLNMGVGSVSLEAIVRSSNSGNNKVVGKRDGAIGYQLGFIVNKFSLFYGTSVGFVSPGGLATISDDKVHHIAMVVDITNEVMFGYIDGVQDLSESLSAVLGNLDNAANMFIGSENATSFFNGSMDEVRVYSRALDADEIAQHARGIFKDNSNLELLLKLDDGSGTTATDSSGNSNNGTISGATWVSGNLSVNKVMMTVYEHAGEVALDDPIQYTAAVIGGVASTVIAGNGKKRKRVRLYSNVDAWVKWGENPTATGGSDSMALSANNPEYVDIESGHILHAISR